MKTLQNIADTAYDDIVALRQRLEEARTLFQAIVCARGKDHLIEKLAMIAEERCEEWAEFARLSLDGMEEDLRAIESATAAPQKATPAKRGAGGAA